MQAVDAAATNLNTFHFGGFRHGSKSQTNLLGLSLRNANAEPFEDGPYHSWAGRQGHNHPLGHDPCKLW